MTYTEALQEAKDTCKECLTVNDCVKEECRWYWIIKALEIADRLEQVGKLGVVCKPHKYGSKTEAFAEGYKQAIKDIKGAKCDADEFEIFTFDGEKIATVKDCDGCMIVHCSECIWFNKGYTICKMGNINGGNKAYFCADGERKPALKHADKETLQSAT